jgi:hypothetical protein
MREALITRSQSTPEGTFSDFSFGSKSVHTLELPWRDNLAQKSCIPVGDYICQPHISPKMGRCYLVTNVPSRSFILIHSANLAGNVDLGFDSHLLGCIAPFRQIGYLKNSKGKSQKAGLISSFALSDFLTWSHNEKILLKIRDKTND